jgi:hypothetical protein
VLPTIAGYCLRVRVKLGSSVLDSYQHRMPSMNRNTAEGMDEALGQETYSRPSLALGGSGLTHNETWAGCIVSLTTPTRSLLSASRSVSFKGR